MIALPRRSIAAGVAAATLLAGCRDTASRHNPYPSGTQQWAFEEDRRCGYEKLDRGSLVQASLPDRDCQEFGEPRYMSGVWINEFEGSHYFEGVTTSQEARRRLNYIYRLAHAASRPRGLGKLTWFEFDRRTKGAALPSLPDGAAYAVTMLARSAPTRDGLIGYGQGFSNGLVLADFVLSVRRLD